MKEFLVKEADAYMRYRDFAAGTEENPTENAPAIIFIHGLGCAGSFDYPMLVTSRKLSGYRRIVVDLLGAGYSDKPEDFPYTVTAHAAYLKDFADEIGLDKFIIYGHSLGGAVAIELAALCPERVTHLMLNEPNLDPTGEGAFSYEISCYSREDFAREGFGAIIAERRKTGNRLWTATLSNWLPEAAHGISTHAVRGGTPSWRETLYGLPMAKSLILGENTIFDTDYSELPQRGIKTVTVAGVDHFMAWEDPEAVAAVIAELLEG